jgi:hypothetical protein
LHEQIVTNLINNDNITQITKISLRLSMK